MGWMKSDNNNKKVNKTIIIKKKCIRRKQIKI